MAKSVLLTTNHLAALDVFSAEEASAPNTSSKEKFGP